MGVLKHQATRARRTLAARVVVGRAPGCLLRLGDPGVSAEHASIFWTGDRWEARDLGSSNGTFVDGRLAQPGERMPLQEGTELSFGGEAERWVLEDALPPVASARCLDTGEVRVAQDGLLALPSADAPEIAIFENESGRWLVETGTAARSGVDQEELSTGDARWILSIPPLAPGGVVPTTRRFRTVPRVLGAMILRFKVSHDGDHVQLSLVLGADEIAIGARAYNELLLTLARARRDARNERVLPEEDQGWMHADDLCDMLDCSPENVNVDIHRARQQLAEVGVINAGAIVERRPLTRQIRLGTDRVEIID